MARACQQPLGSMRDAFVSAFEHARLCLCSVLQRSKVKAPVEDASQASRLQSVGVVVKILHPCFNSCSRALETFTCSLADVHFQLHTSWAALVQRGYLGLMGVRWYDTNQCERLFCSLWRTGS